MRKAKLIITALLLFTNISFAQKQKSMMIDGGVQNGSADNLITHLKLNKLDTSSLRILNDTGNAFLRKNDFANASAYFNLNLSRSDEILSSLSKFDTASINKCKKEQIKALSLLADVFNKEGKNVEEFKMDLSALTIADNINDNKLRYACYYRLGHFYDNNEDFKMALDNYLIALRTAEVTNDTDKIIEVTWDISSMYILENDVDSASKYENYLLQLSKIKGYDAWVALAYSKIAWIYKKKRQYKNALMFYQLDSLLFSKCNTTNVPFIIDNIGAIYDSMGNKRLGLDYHIRALKFEKELGNNWIYPFSGTYHLIASSYLELGMYNKALSIAILALNNMTGKDGRNEHWLRDRKDQYSLLAEIYYKMHNYKMAYDTELLYKETNDSLFEKEKSKKISDLNNKFELDKFTAEQEKKDAISKTEIKRQTIIKNATLGGVGIAGIFSFLLVRAINRRRKTIFDKQVSEVEMKALRSQMNPHFIFNSLNSIDDYIQKNDIENSSKYLNKFSRLTRAILESSRMEEVPLKNDLDTLDLYIQLENLRMKNKINYSINITPELDAEQTLIPPMLLQPFVENAFKHAFAGIENPRMDIDIALKDGMIVCTLKDNGIGREKSQVITLEEKIKHESLGLKVTQERLDIINRIKKSQAYIAFEDLKDGNLKAAGTKVQLAIPVSYMF